MNPEEECDLLELDEDPEDPLGDLDNDGFQVLNNLFIHIRKNPLYDLEHREYLVNYFFIRVAEILDKMI